MRNRKLVLLATSVVLVTSSVPSSARAEQARRGIRVGNWEAASSWTPLGALAIASGPLPFVPITPCRVADTRVGAGFSGAYGPPSIAASTSRTFDIAASGCTGIPSTAAAFSFNFTVTNTQGPGFIQAYPAGEAGTTTSTVNYTGAGQTVANAAVTPAGTGTNAGKITVTAGVSTTDVIIDINGYYSGAASSGRGMTLTSTGGNDTLTLVNASGLGSALVVSTTTSGYPLKVDNYSTTCIGGCGGSFSTTSTSSNSPNALMATAWGSANQTYGVRGYTKGDGPTYDYTGSAAGVYGEASNAGSAHGHGVVGVTFSSSGFGAGVWGEATAGYGNGGIFQSSAVAGKVVRTYVSYFDSGSLGVGIDTNGKITGSLGLAISGGTKNFVTPHPEDPAREIEYVAAEGPASNVFFVGSGRLQDGVAVIPVPDHFRLVAREDSYLATLTPVGAPSGLWVESQGPSAIVVRGSGSARFNYVVWGERDEFRDHQPVVPNRTFTPEAMERSRSLPSYPASTKALLVKNGTLNEDGSYNRATAARLGWRIPEPEPPAAPAVPGPGGLK